MFITKHVGKLGFRQCTWSKAFAWAEVLGEGYYPGRTGHN
jgi:hypothetical protein